MTQTEIAQFESVLDSIAGELLHHATPQTAELYRDFLKSLQNDLRGKFGDVFENFPQSTP